MNRKKFLWLMAALLPTTLLGKGEVVYTRLQSFYSNAGMVTIDKVVLSDTATVMYCRENQLLVSIRTVHVPER